jgi:hypothetical protein
MGDGKRQGEILGKSFCGRQRTKANEEAGHVRQAGSSYL